MPEDFKDNEEEKVMLENKILRANKSMRQPEELIIVHIFLREATLTPFKHTPNYPRFKEHCINIFKFVGRFNSVLGLTTDRLNHKICLKAVRAGAKEALYQCIKQLLDEGGLDRDQEKRLRKYIEDVDNANVRKI